MYKALDAGQLRHCRGTWPWRRWALPCADLPPTAQKPWTPRALRAAVTALFQAPRELLNIFLAWADRALDTILPDLFLTSLSLVNPPEVFTLKPRNTELFALLPVAMTDFRFMAFMAFIAFMPVAAFMADFMVRIGRAIASKCDARKPEEQICQAPGPRHLE